jgi:hypothetical protein
VSSHLFFFFLSSAKEEVKKKRREDTKTGRDNRGCGDAAMEFGGMTAGVKGKSLWQPGVKRTPRRN